MKIQSLLASLCFFSATSLSANLSQAETIILDDYENGGVFEPAPWANTSTDTKGNQNRSRVADKVAVVQWATEWSGLPSAGDPQDLSKFKTFQADVMVEKGQPVEADANFYFQLVNQSGIGYSFWETLIPHDKIPADGKWYRVQFPLSKMTTGSGDGGSAPSDFKTINGIACGMNYDAGGDQFEMKEARFDTVVLTDTEVEEVTVSPKPKDEAEKK